MNKVLRKTPNSRPRGSTGNMINPNLARNAPITEINITPEITKSTVIEENRFSSRKRDGESLVYLVT